MRRMVCDPSRHLETIRTVLSRETNFRLILEIVKSLMFAADAKCEVKIQDAEISDESIDFGVEDFVDSRYQSMIKKEDVDAAVKELDHTTTPCTQLQQVNLLDEAAVREVYLEVDKFIKQHHHQKERADGQVSFSIFDSNTQMTFCVFETWKRVSFDGNKGLYHLVKEMIAASNRNDELQERNQRCHRRCKANANNASSGAPASKPAEAPQLVYGVCTDAEQFIFLRLDCASKKFTRSSSCGFFECGANPILSWQAVKVAAYLLHIFNFTPDFSLSDMMAAIEQLKVEKAKRLGLSINKIREQLQLEASNASTVVLL